MSVERESLTTSANQNGSGEQSGLERLAIDASLRAKAVIFFAREVGRVLYAADNYK